MTNHFTQAQAATVQDGGQTFCTPPANDVKPVRVPPAGSSLGECAHFDALGNALQVGDTVEFIDADIVTITGLLPCGRFLYDHDRTNFCCVVVRSAPAPDQGVNAPQHLEALLVVDTLYAQLPPDSKLGMLSQEFQKPLGFWFRLHPGCALNAVIGLSHRTARSAAGGAL